MEPYDLLRRVVEACEDLRIPYFVTGSVASMYYGEPRFTNDIDLVADLRPDQVEAFVACFPPGEFYLSEEAVREAIRHRMTFNIIHPSSGLKVDVSLHAGDDFDASRFRRARPVEPVSGLTARFSSPEDLILKKLVFYQEGRSEKHLRDILAMLLLSGGEIDLGYVSEWVARLGLWESWAIIEARLKERGGEG